MISASAPASESAGTQNESPGLDGRFVAAAAVYAIFLLLLGQRPAVEISKLDWAGFLAGGDKIAHGAAYCILGALVWRAQVPRSRKLSAFTSHPAISTVLLVAMWGGLDELSQGLANRGRSMSIFDLLADTSGALVALAAAAWFRRDSKH